MEAKENGFLLTDTVKILNVAVGSNRLTQLIAKLFMKVQIFCASIIK